MPLCSTHLALLGEPFALRRERPPRQRRAAFHEGNDRHEHIDHTGIVPRAGFRAERVIHLERLSADELLRVMNAKQTQIGRTCLADIGQVFEFGGVGLVCEHS